MAETEEVINPGTTEPSPFAPSLMSQAHDLLGGTTAAAFIAKRQIGNAAEDLELNKKELEQLCRIWAKPFGKLAEKYPSFPWVIAGTMTMGIVVEKVLIFYIAKEERERQKKRDYDLASRRDVSKVEEIQSASRANA